MAYFICCGFGENYKIYYYQNIFKELLDNSIIYDTFGGKIDISKLKGLDKMISKKDKREVKILLENINKFIDKIKLSV